MMRYQESDLVCEALKAIGLKHLERVDAEETFLNATTEIEGKVVGPLSKVSDPEAKRRIIGDVFYHLVTDAIRKSGLNLDETFIAQGTLRPDLIESGNREISSQAHTIKTHHNDVPLIQEQRKKGLIVEPNRDWHKDEVRKVGRMSVMEMRAKARKIQMEAGGDLGLIVIDYLQLMQGPGGGSGNDANRTQEISAISRGLKGLARELKVPVIALSQLSRAVESRQDKKPMPENGTLLLVENVVEGDNQPGLGKLLDINMP